MQNTSFDNEADYNDDLDSAAALEAESCVKLTVLLDMARLRLDSALAKLMPDYSRSRLATWIKGDLVIVNGKPARSKEKLIDGEFITVMVRSSEESLALLPEKMDLDIVYEDDTVIVVNKLAGSVVHPAVGDWSGTLLNGLLAHCPELGQIPRAGIVYRLDKEASGPMAVVRTLPAQNSLVRQLQERTVKRIYHAVANGIVSFDGEIEILVSRDPHNRPKTAVVKYGGEPVITYVKALERHPTHSHTECSLETGRTYQIRVHMCEANHPLAADPIYGNPRHLCSGMVKEAVKALGRQALHAYRLSFLHPRTQKVVSFEAAIPENMYHLLSALRLEAGLDSSLSHEEEWFNKLNEEDDDDRDEDDYDVEIVHTGD